MGLMKLDTQDFSSLFQRAKEMYEHTTNETLRDSDPVFTMMETQVMLVDMLNYYMESITTKQKKQHQELMDIHADTTMQYIYLYIQNNYAEFYRTSKIYHKQLFTFLNGKQLCYAEAMHAYPLFSFDISYSVMVQQQEATPIQMIFDNHTTCFHSLPVQEQDSLYLCVEQHLPMHETLYLSILCDSSMRNQKGNPQLFQDEWVWEYYSMHGWQRLKVKDETCGLRYTGEISFQIHKHMDKITLFQKQGFWIRVVKQEVMEKVCLHINDIRFHYIMCQPGITQAMSQEYVNMTTIPFNQAFDTHTVFGKQEKDSEWTPCDDSIQQIDGIDYCIPLQSFAMYRIVYHRTQLQKEIETFSITGVSSQHITISNTQQLAIALESDGKLRDYPIFSGKHYVATIGAIQEENGIRFGNGRDVLIPKANSHGLWVLNMQTKTVWNHEFLHAYIPQETYCTLCQIESLKKLGYQTALLSDIQVKQYVETIEGCMFHMVEVSETAFGYHIAVKGAYEHSFDPLWLEKVKQLIEQNLCYGSKIELVEMI